MIIIQKILVMRWLFICCLLKIVCSENGTPSNSEEDLSSSRSSLTSDEQNKIDLNVVDYEITEIYEEPGPAQKQKLIDNLHLYLKTLRRLNKMTKKACQETTAKASRLVHSGGPHFLKTKMFYSDEEKILKKEMQFTDLEFQEYQFYRLDTENEWSELKDQIAHVDRDKEKETEKRNVIAVTDLNLADTIISDIYNHPGPVKIQKLLDTIHLYLITLRRFNTMTKKGCYDTREEASELVHSGGPNFLKTNAFYSDEEQVFRKKMNFTDFQFQEYQYYRLDTETEWTELKELIAQLYGPKNETVEAQ